MAVFADIQTAIYSKLDTALATPVYSTLPQTVDSGDATNYPYITIGNDIYTDWGTFDAKGLLASITINIWSREEGQKETKTIMGDIDAVMNRANLTVSGYNVLGVDYDQSQIFVDSDGKTWHGVMTYSIYLHES